MKVEYSLPDGKKGLYDVNTEAEAAIFIQELKDWLPGSTAFIIGRE